MPSSINLQGLRIYRPGIYGIVDASSLGGSGISTGNVAIVGAFPTFEQNEPLTFTSARAVRDFDPDDVVLQTLAKTAFSPSSDDRVGGGAATLTLVNTQGTTQAGYPFGLDAVGSPSIDLQSKLWGPIGNRTFCALAKNAADNDGIDVTISRGSSSEVFENLQSGAVFNAYFSGNELNSAVFDCSTSNLLWTWKKQYSFAGSGNPDQTFAGMTELLCGVGGGTVTSPHPVTDPAVAYIEMTDGATVLTSGKTVTVTVTGIDASGATVVATPTTITYAELNADPTVQKTVQFAAANVRWSSITNVVYAIDQTDFDGDVRLGCVAFNLDLANDFDYIGQVASYVDQNANKGWHAVAVHTRINNIPADELDLNSEQTYNAAASTTNQAELRADLWAIVTGMSSSRLVTAARATNADRRPGPVDLTTPLYDEQGFMVGGSAAVSSVADYDDGLAAIEYSDVQIVVPESSDILVGKKLIAHCKASAIAGYERNGWFGAPASQSLAVMFSGFSSQLNSRHVACVGQEILAETSAGALEFLPPLYLAVMLAGMQAGTAVATPLTWKRPNVFELRQSWDPNRDANEAIQKGICTLSTDSLGVRVERSVTSYMEDDNPIYSEVSANESINTSIRDLRAALKIRIGDAVYGNTAAKLQSVVEARLNGQVRDGVIKAWQNVSLVDGGDSISVTYEVAAVEPLNFIVLTANVVRISEV